MATPTYYLEPLLCKCSATFLCRTYNKTIEFASTFTALILLKHVHVLMILVSSLFLLHFLYSSVALFNIVSFYWMLTVLNNVMHLCQCLWISLQQLYMYGRLHAGTLDLSTHPHSFFSFCVAILLLLVVVLLLSGISTGSVNTITQTLILVARSWIFIGQLGFVSYWYWIHLYVYAGMAQIY